MVLQNYTQHCMIFTICIKPRQFLQIKKIYQNYSLDLDTFKQ